MLIIQLSTIPGSSYNISVKDIILGIKDKSNQNPSEFALLQNYPNPFNPATNIDYQLPFSGNVILKTHDILGREMVILVNADQ